MTFNINDMRSQLTFGGARAALFSVQITNPINSNGDLKVPFMVQASSLPGSTIGSIEVPYFGRKIKIAGDRTFDEWTVTVTNDEDFLIRNAMEEWTSAINSHQGNLRELGSSSPSEYKSQAQITQYAKTGEALREYTFVGLFPTTIEPITTDWNTTDEIETFDVTFQYDFWTIQNSATGLGGTNA